MYVTEMLCYTPETNTTLQINYTSIKKITIKKGEVKKEMWPVWQIGLGNTNFLHLLPPNKGKFSKCEGRESYK